MNFSTRLHNLIKSNNLKASELAKILDIANSSLSKYLNDNSAVPNAEILYKLAKYFNVSMEFLLKGESFNYKNDPILDPLLDKINKLNKYDREDIEVMVDTKLKRYGEGLSSSSMISDKYDKIG